MLTIADNHLSAINSAVQRCSDGVARSLQPSDPADAAVIRAFLELTGKTARSHPGLYADLDKLGSAAAADPAGHDSQVLTVVDRGRDAHGRATARVWHLDRDGGFLAGSLALVLDADAGKPLALGYANRVGGGLAPAATRSESAEQAPDRTTTVGFYHSQSAPDAAPKFGMVAQTATVQAGGMIDATVTDPITTKGHPAVQIGLGRPNPSLDLDYRYSQDTNDYPQLVVPFTGTVNTQQPLANVGPNGQFTAGLAVSTQLYSIVGSSYVAHNPGQSLNTQVTGNTATNVVTWQYPYDPADLPNAYTSLMYGSSPNSNNNNLTAFFFAFEIPVNNPVAPLFQFNVCSTDWPEQPSVNCVQILPLSFWWHCLAEGTKVTLADGSTLEIEHVDNAKRVRTGAAGGTLGVEATTRGLHHVRDPADPVNGVYRLTTAGGRSLVLTGGHPVSTPDGLVRASDLSEGDPVLTEDGVEQVASLRPEESTGVFANLKLVDHSDRARGLAGTVGTFIANGVVVGDFDSMAQLHYNTTHSLDYMVARIPQRYHTDYASTLADIARDNVRYGAKY